MLEDIKKAIEYLRNGGVILYPTDTVWGLGCDATNPEAVKKIYNIKKREDNKSMLVLIENPARLGSYVGEVPEIAWELIDASVSPLTIIYPNARNLAKNLVAEDGSVGIRITNDPFCCELIKRFGKPVVSSSANISGELTPAVFSDIKDEIIASADYVIQWRQDDFVKRLPSSIIKLGSGGLFKIIRT